MKKFIVLTTLSIIIISMFTIALTVKAEDGFQPPSTPMICEIEGNSVPSPQEPWQNHWWKIDFWADTSGGHLPSQINGRLIAVANTIGNLMAGTRPDETPPVWYDAVLYLPLNVAYGNSATDCVWFQFDLQFVAPGLGSQYPDAIEWYIWDIRGPGNDVPEDYHHTELGIPYTVGHEYSFSLTTSGTNTVTFSIVDTTSSASWSISDWAWTVPNLNLLYDQGVFSPASAVEGYTTNDALAFVPYFQTRVGDGVTHHWYGSSGTAPTGIQTDVIKINDDFWYWEMLAPGRLPIPSITSVDYPGNMVVGEPATIDVQATNTGGTATWQTIAVSFPATQPVSDVTVESPDLSSFSIKLAGGTASSAYSSAAVVLLTYLIEGTSEWPNGVNHHLKITVTPTTEGDFVFFVKSVSGVVNWASNWTPKQSDSSGAGYSIGQDQQGEAVRVYTAAVGGGPDSFGYTYLGSNAIGGPTYNWVEISATGTEILSSSDDSWVGNIGLGFFFNYYGTDYSQLAIGNNGLLFSGVGTSQYVNQPITHTPGIHGLIAPFWDDIVTWGSAGAIYYETQGTSPNRKFIVEWYDNQHYSSSTSGITFEAILYEGTNNILFQYKDVDFGSVSGSTGSDLPPYNNGGSATVGIEDPTGNIGLQYSFNQQVINPGLAILFKFPAFAGTNMYLSMNAPASMDHGSTMTYTLYYNDFGDVAAQNVVLQTTLSSSVDFVSASDSGTYDAVTRRVTWNIGTVPAFPSGRGTRTATVTIPASVSVGTVIQTTASISTTTLETRIDDNSASAQTTVTGSNLPPNVGVGPTLGNSGGTPSVYWSTPITFTYYDAAATGVDIRIHLDDGGADMTGSMTGGPPTWTYTVTFYPRHGHATVTYTVHYPTTTSQVSFNIYVDPAGYVYNVVTLQRISGASLWLQRSDGQGGWENVPTGQMPPIMQPDVNPQITGTDGQYQWDVLEGSYRVHVEAAGYYPADSIVINVPPPVTDLNVALTPLPPPPDPTPPTTTYTIDDPKYTDPSGNVYVTSATPITLSAEDNLGGSGVATTGYCIRNAASYNSGWTTSTPPIELHLTGLSDGEYFIDFNSTDNVGNIETTHTVPVILDNSGPSIVVENPPAGCALQDGVTFIALASDSSGTHGLNFSIREANGDQGIPVGFEDMPATYNTTTGRWELFFNTLQLQDGFYIVLVNAEDNLGHMASIAVPYSIRNWAVLELLPATPNNRAGRTMPIKFALRVAATVDPDQPFVYNEELTIKIYTTDNPGNILQTSTFGNTAKDYRINTLAEHYITNFQTLKTPKTYIAEIWRKDMLIGNIEFETVTSKGLITENFEFTRIY